MTTMIGEEPALPEAAEIDECETVIACLGDDAVLLRRTNPYCEIAANLDEAADWLEKLRAALGDLYRLCRDCDLEQEDKRPTEQQYTAAMDAASAALGPNALGPNV